MPRGEAVFRIEFADQSSAVPQARPTPAAPMTASSYAPSGLTAREAVSPPGAAFSSASAAPSLAQAVASPQQAAYTQAMEVAAYNLARLVRDMPRLTAAAQAAPAPQGPASTSAGAAGAAASSPGARKETFAPDQVWYSDLLKGVTRAATEAEKTAKVATADKPPPVRATAAAANFPALPGGGFTSRSATADWAAAPQAANPYSDQMAKLAERMGKRFQSIGARSMFDTNPTPEEMQPSNVRKAMSGLGGKADRFLGVESAASGSLKGAGAAGVAYEVARAVLASVDKHAENIGAATAGSVPGGFGTAAAVGLSAMEELGKKIPGVSAAFKALEVTTRMLEAIEKQRARNIEHVGAAGSDLMRGDILGARTKQLEKEKEEWARLGTVGKIRNWWVGVEREVAGLKAFGAMREASLQQADRLAPYSTALSSAKVEATAIRMRSDFGQAQRHGGSLARFSVAQAQFESAAMSATSPQREQMLETLIRLTNEGRVMEAKEAADQLEKLNDLGGFLKLIQSGTAEGVAAHKRFQAELKRLREGKDDRFTGPGGLKQLMDGLELLPRDNQARDPVMGGWARQAMVRPLG